MSLIHCSECNAMISDKAMACPHCGCPVESISTSNQNKYPIPQKDFKCPTCGNTTYTIQKIMPFIFWVCDKCNDSRTYEKVSKEELESHQRQQRLSKQVSCPYCHSTITKKIGTFGRLTSFNTIGKQWHCKSCGSNF